MENTNILKIFLGSPSDVKTERELIFALQNDLNHLIGKPNNIRFEFVNWEKDAYPGIGIDAQDVINNSINEDFDIFIGIFWLKFGTKTNRAESGTEEEFEIAWKRYNQNPNASHIMMYFKTASPSNIYDFDFKQFEKVKNFKTSLQTRGVLYWEFETPEDLKNLLLIHLSSLIKDKFSEDKFKILSKNTNDSLSIKVEKDKYELLAEKIDNENDITEYDGMLELLEMTIDSMNELPMITERVTLVINSIASKFAEKTKQTNILKNIKDDRLKIKKLNEISNKMALDLNNYAEDINELIPEFSETMNKAIESYSKTIITANNITVFQDEAKTQMEDVYPTLKANIEIVLEQIAGFINEFSNIPVLTSKFGTAKRKAELATNAIFKEFINARNILNQLDQ